MAISQRQAVFMATLAALSAKGIEFVPGKTIIHDVCTKELKESVVDSVCAMFQSGEVSFKDTPENAKKLEDAKELRRYVAGLVTNWHNKDTELNAGCKYEAKNPGSRAGSADPQVKEMKLLKTKLEAAGNTEGAAKVETAIQLRLNELKAAKAATKTVQINVENLPEELRSLVEAAQEV